MILPSAPIQRMPFTPEPLICPSAGSVESGGLRVFLLPSRRWVTHHRHRPSASPLAHPPAIASSAPSWSPARSRSHIRRNGPGAEISSA